MLSNNINHFDKAFRISQMKENRKGGRFPTTSVRSSLGEVLDLSSGGALILKRKLKKLPSDEAFVVEIKYEEIRTCVQARMVRHAKKRGIGHLVAIAFVDIDEAQCEAIKEIIRNSRSWRIFDMSISEAA